MDSWDDLVPLERGYLNSIIIAELDVIRKCPHLSYRDTCFLYCRARASRLFSLEIRKSSVEPCPDSAEYHSQVGDYELQSWCIGPEEKRADCEQYKWAKEKEIVQD